MAISAIDDMPIELWGTLMMYTDINVQGMEMDAIYDLYDHLTSDSSILAPMYEYIRDDHGQMLKMSYAIDLNIERRIEAKRNKDGLSALMKAFAEDETPDSTISDARQLSETLIDMYGKAKEFDSRK